MISDYVLNPMVSRLRWGVFTLDNIPDLTAAIAAATEDYDSATLEHYFPSILQVVQLICNGINPAEYIDIHDINWVNHVSIQSIIDNLTNAIQLMVGMQCGVKLGMITGTHDYILECRNGPI